MSISRRILFAQAGSLLIASAAAPSAAETVTYLYDPLGRVIRATYSDGTIVVYTYDRAGNRGHVVRTDGSAYAATLQVTGGGPVNLRDLADSSGYSGITDATITFQVGAAVTILGAPGTPNGGAGIDTGAWPSDKSITLALQVSGKVYGGGGKGGQGAGDTGFPGEPGAGGDAIYCRHNIAITVNSGGQVKAGGGGGGGGGGWWREITVEGAPFNSWYNGGGGGGGFPNGPPGLEGSHDDEFSHDVANAGNSGTTSGGGASGSGGGAGSGRATGAGGAGGAAAAAGSNGAASTGSINATYNKTSESLGAAPGYAIRKDGKTVTVTNNGTIAGTVG